MAKPHFLPGCSSPAIASDYADTQSHVRRIARLVHTYKDEIDLCQFSAKHGLFVVRYGVQIWQSLTYAEAAKVFGESLLHALTCEGKLNN